MRGCTIATLSALVACAAPPAPATVAQVPSSERRRPNAPATAEEVVRRVRARYAALRTYQDTGVVLSYWVDPPAPQRLAFSTAFRRPTDFRFEWKESPRRERPRAIEHHGLVWSDAGHGFVLRWVTGGYPTLDPPPTPERLPSLEYAIAAGAGVSQESVALVPALLLGLSDRGRLSGPMTLLEPQPVDGVLCLRIALERDQQTYEWWVGADDLLVRKVVWLPGPGHPIAAQLLRTEELHSTIIVDAPIASSTFGPPPPLE